MFKNHNPLSKAFGVVDSDHRLTEFDWAGAGVEQTYLIVFTGRTGSTLLTRMIDKTGLCGTPSEYFIESFVANQHKHLNGATDPKSYLANVVPRFTRHGIFGAEIDSMRLQWLDQVIDVAGVFPAATTPHVWMTRTDIAAQAFSFVSALLSGRWHVFEGMGNVGLNAVDPSGEIGDTKVWDHIMRILREEQATEQYFARNGISPFRITYEEFIADKVLSVARILRHVGVELPAQAARDLAVQDPTRRLDYDTKNEFLLGFEARHADAMRYLRDNRTRPDLAELRRMLGR